VSVSEALSAISIWSIVVPLIAGLFFLKQLSFDSFLIWGIVVLGTIPQLLRAFTDNRALLTISYNAYTAAEFVLMFFFFKKTIQRKKIVYALSLLYLLVSGFLLTRYGFFDRFLNEWVCANNFIYTAWVLLVLIEKYETGDSMRLDFQVPFFWYIAGLLFYCPCTTLVFSLWYYIRTHPDTSLQNLWVIHSVFNIALYFFITVGILKNHQWHEKRLNYSNKL
jgi:hypothetical protein